MKIKICIALLLGVMSLPAKVLAAEYTFRLAETWSEGFPIFGDVSELLAKRVHEMSNGRLKIEIDSSSTHGKGLGIWDMVQSGEYQMGHSASYYYAKQDPNALFFTTMPFGMLPIEQYSWFYYGGGMELMEQVYAKHGLLSFPGGNTGSQMGGWFQTRIRSLDDLKGLKMRVPGFAGEVMAELGVIPTNIPAGELLGAMQDNRIQAVEWVGPSLDLKLSLHLSAQFYYTGWHEPATELNFIVNKKAFDSLPADLQEILRVAMRSSAYDMYIQATHESAENWSSLRINYSIIRVKNFPKPVLEAMQAASHKLLLKKSAKDKLSAQILKSQEDYLSQVRAWTEISDFSYLESANEIR
ncbi:TRAP transporter substrate-binding protein DctP [Aestuariirhabdus sp. Z084]|uniref:TRAP transporter substrate-binding protein n=1 Tax=Aestuariirhabdus haliotis TaxID=2918751 RepID=UPI00201B3B6C|nr:TRAP transporter substrate-binding protein DctP [Aestuariirhabdus haliotis]MCL6414061.1 TRAP transporter substrate-binding protein DctP [Aestuariirhabdus haliotis]MCL6417994.1 TRAP transporter substrate-binding protein DctP [Aestuariirhabdus haliotis]